MAGTAISALDSASSDSTFVHNSKHNNDHGELDRHLSCDICAKQFTTVRDLNRHKKRHERPYACTVCNQRFALQHDKDRHQSRHGTLTQLQCLWPYCSFRGTDRKDNLLRHMNKLHGECASKQSTDMIQHEISEKIVHLYQQSIEQAGLARKIFQKERNPQLKFFKACIQGLEQNVKKLLTGNLIDKNMRDSQGRTVLICAIDNGQWPVAEILLQNGFDPNVTDNRGRTSLNGALSRGNLEFARHLIVVYGAQMPESKEDFVKQYVKSNVNGKLIDLLSGAGKINGSLSDFWKAVLREASTQNNIELVKVSLDRDTDDKVDWLALKKAIESGHIEVVQLFLNRGVDIRNYRGQEALCDASKHNHIEVVKLLLDRGVDIRGYHGQEALFKASRDNQIEVVKLLIDGGIDINVSGKNGTALINASSAGNVGLVQFLVQNGADVNKRGLGVGPYATALGCAVQNSHADVEEYLLQNGAETTFGIIESLRLYDSKSVRRFQTLGVDIRGAMFRVLAESSVAENGGVALVPTEKIEASDLIQRAIDWTDSLWIGWDEARLKEKRSRAELVDVLREVFSEPKPMTPPSWAETLDKTKMLPQQWQSIPQLF